MTDISKQLTGYIIKHHDICCYSGVVLTVSAFRFLLSGDTSKKASNNN